MKASSMLLMGLLGCSTAADAEPTLPSPALEKGQAEAVFAGGCFWCMEPPFDAIEGVIATHSGYTGGDKKGPAYTEVAYGRTSHVEALRVVYDPAKVSYKMLLDVFWKNIDPTQDDGQFCDRGAHYRSAIFPGNAAERSEAEASRIAVGATLGKTIVTTIRPKADFWMAEDYHQDFYKKNPGRYYSYRAGCGRDRRLTQLWGKTAN